MSKAPQQFDKTPAERFSLKLSLARSNLRSSLDVHHFITSVFMVRGFALAFALSWLPSVVGAQTQPAAKTAATQLATPAKPAAGKPTPNAKTDAKPAAPTEIGRCQIGVIPIAGNLFTIRRIGPVALNNTYAQGGAEWGLDELVVSRIRAAVPGAAVRRIAFSKEELARAPVSLFRNIRSELKDFARHVAAGTNCDRYVVVHRSGRPPLFGIGIAKFVSLLGGNRTFLYALMHVRIYDGQTFELIKEGPVLIDDESLLARAYLNPVGGPYRALDDSSFPASPAEAIASPTLREGIRALLTASLDKTLPAMLRQTTMETSQ